MNAFSIRKWPTLPAGALLARYGAEGAAVDCYIAEIHQAVTLPEFVEAFYTTPLFRMERAILAVAVSKPSTDAELRQLARGEGHAFAAWTVEDRTADQLLLADFMGSTRSWLMVASAEAGSPGSTQLRFGSAVLPRPGSSAGKSGTDLAFSLLMPFHALYSRLLLSAARSKLARNRRLSP
jgi:hypothetical protein